MSVSGNLFNWLLVALALTSCANTLQFSPELSDFYVVLDKPLWWTCSVLNAGQTPSLTFLWRFQDGDMVQDGTRIAYGNGTLYFPKVLYSHFGKYTCIVSDSQSIIESSAYLRLAYISNSIVLNPNDQSAILGSAVVLDCTTDGRPAPNLNWTLNGLNVVRTSRVVVTDLEVGHSMLQINNITYIDSGSYTCTVSHVTLAQPLSSAPAVVRVYGRPVITSMLLNQVVPVGYNVTFQCPANSEPKATLTWLFLPSIGDGTQTQLSSSQPSVYVDNINGILQLFNAGDSRNGVYYCTWNNQYGSAFSQATLTVAGNPQAPVFTVRPLDANVTEGSDVTLSCNGTGNPGVTVSWVGPTGQVISTNLATQATDLNNQMFNDSVSTSRNNSLDNGFVADQAVTGNTGLLIIRNVHRTDLGVYKCRLVNSEGEVESVAYVNVLYTPYVITSPQSMTVNEGSPFSLSCAAVGNPQPVISWTLPNSFSFNLTSANSGVSSNKNEVVLDTGDLQVANASRIHRGTFTCYATNSIGSTSASATVSVSGVPGFSVTPVSQGVVEGDAVVLQCQVDAFPAAQVDWYYRYIMDLSIQSTDILQYIKDSVSQNMPTENMTMLQAGQDTRFSYVNGTSLRFEHAEGEDAGLYLCLATNDHGSAFVAAILRVITFPVFQVAPTDTRAALGSTVRLDCFCVGIPVPSQRWVFNQRSLQMNSRTSLYINGSLSITNMQESDLGTYTCIATNQAGQRLRSAILTVSKLPYFLIAPTNTTTASGFTTVIPCRGSSSTSFEVSWYVSDMTGNLFTLLGQTVGNQNPASPVDQPPGPDRIQISSEGDLLFKCVEKSDSTWYICVLRNSDGGTPSDPVFLTVDSFPSILSTEVPGTMFPGQTENITCQATGSPLPVISWLTPVKVEYTETSVGDVTVSVMETSQYVNSTLTITNLQMGRDAGVWTCKACNEVGCGLKRVTLNIEGNAVIRQIIAQEYDNSFLISCITAGVPVPNITYSSGGIPITNLTEGHTIITNDLWIQKDKILSGYTCQTDNVNGSYEILSLPPSVLVVNVKPTTDSFTVSMTHSEPIPYLTPNKVIVRFAVDGTNLWQNQTFYLSRNIEDYLDVEAGAVSDNSTSGSCGTATGGSIVKRNANIDSSVPKDINISINSTGSQWIFSIEANIHDLKPNTAYVLQATVANILGPGPYSPTINIKTLAAAPSPVTNVTVSVYNRTATVAWSNPDPLNGLPEDTTVTVQLFNSLSITSVIATATVNVLQQPMATFPNLQTGDYSLQIFAHNSRTNTTSIVVTAAFQVQDYPPSYKPIIQGIKALNAHTVQLNWTVPSNLSSIYPPVTGYTIEVSTVDHDNAELHKVQQSVDVSGDTVFFKNIDNLIENTMYFMRVASRNSAGTGPYSDSRNATTPLSEFSEKVVDSSTPWRIVAIVLIVVSSSLIILAVILVVMYQMKIAKIKSVNLDSQPESDIQLDNKSEEEMQHDTDSRTVEGYENNNTILY